MNASVVGARAEAAPGSSGRDEAARTDRAPPARPHQRCPRVLLPPQALPQARQRRRPHPRARTPFFKRMARRLRTARLMERAGLRFVAAPRRLEAAYDDDRADARGGGAHGRGRGAGAGGGKGGARRGPRRRRRRRGRRRRSIRVVVGLGRDSDHRGDRRDAPAAGRARASLTPAAAVALASRALRLTLKRERGHGNCMFCAFASGLNSWLERGDARRPAGGTTSGPCPSARTPPRCTARSPVRTAAGSNGPTCAARWSGPSRTPSRMRERGTGTGS